MRRRSLLLSSLILTFTLATTSAASDKPDDPGKAVKTAPPISAEADASATASPKPILLDVSIHADTTLATGARLVLVAEDGTRTELMGLMTAGSRDVTQPAAAVDAAVVVTCVGDGWWCPEIRLDAATPARGRRARLPLFAATRWGGRVVTPGRDLPPNLLVQGWLRLTPEHDPLASFATNVAIAGVGDDAGRWHLDVPIAQLDLRISAKGFATVYRWGLRPEHEPTSTLRLVPGSSVAGFVVDAVNDLPAVGARVTAVPAGTTGDDPVHRRASPTLPIANTNRRGFFQIAGLPPGVYRLEAALPKRPLTSFEPVTVSEDAESVLGEAIMLVAPVTLDLHVTPVATAGDTPWVISLEPRVAPRDVPPVIDQRVDERGFARFEGLAAQSYRLRVIGENDSLFDERSLTMEHDTTLDLTLPLILVTGTVQLEKKPIEATLRFETGAGEAIAIESDEEGAFRGWIRRPEHPFLFVQIAGRAPRFERRLTVPVSKVRNQTLELDLELSGAEVAGDTVDQQGNPLRGVRIELFHGADRLARARTDAQGDFRFVAVAPGTYQLMARHSEYGDAEPVTINIDEGRSPLRQRLTLVPRTHVVGQIRAASGHPVAGVTYELTAVGPFPTVSPRRQADLDGRFRARIGAQASHVVVRVYAPGHVLWSGCLPITPDQPFDIVLPPTPGGTLTVRLEADPKHPPRTNGRLVIFGEHGGFFDWGDLVHWQTQTQARNTTDGNATLIDVPRIAANRRYGVAWSTDPWPIVAAQACGLRPVSDAAWNHVPLGGSTLLTLDSPAL